MARMDGWRGEKEGAGGQQLAGTRVAPPTHGGLFATLATAPPVCLLCAGILMGISRFRNVRCSEPIAPLHAAQIDPMRDMERTNGVGGGGPHVRNTTNYIPSYLPGLTRGTTDAVSLRACYAYHRLLPYDAHGASPLTAAYNVVVASRPPPVAFRYSACIHGACIYTHALPSAPTTRA